MPEIARPSKDQLLQLLKSEPRVELRDQIGEALGGEGERESVVTRVMTRTLEHTTLTSDVVLA